MVLSQARFLLVALVGLFVVTGVKASDISPCTNTFAYDAAVNVYVLEDTERGATVDLQEVRRRLAWLVRFDILLQDNYGSLGTHSLRQLDQDRPCTVDTVIEQAQRILPPNGAAVFIDQRIYREKNDIFLQTYVSFHRVDTERRMVPERVEFAPLPGASKFYAVLPAQVAVFPPRRLRATDLAAIEKAFIKRSRLYFRPRSLGRWSELPLSSEEPLPILVPNRSSDGWLRVEADKAEPPISGWLRVDREVNQELRKIIPELEFIEGIVGYLSYLQASGGRFLRSEVARDIAMRAGDVLGRYAKTNKDGQAQVLAEAVRATLALKDSKHADTALRRFFVTVQRSSPDSRTRNLLGIMRLFACCGVESPHHIRFGAGGVIGLSGALSDFQSALAIDPTSYDTLHNLEALYGMLPELTEFPPPQHLSKKEAPSFREAYTRAIARLPLTKSELNDRRSEVLSLTTSAATPNLVGPIADLGTAADAKAMLEKAVAELKADGVGALEKFKKGEGGYRDRDLYVFCFETSTGKFTAHPQPSLLGVDVRTLKDRKGEPFGERVYEAVKAGRVEAVEYMFPKPGRTKPVPKESFITKVGSQGCGVGYYK